MNSLEVDYPELVEGLPPYLIKPVTTSLALGRTLYVRDEPESLCSLINRACWKYGVPVREFLKKVLRISVGRKSEMSHEIASKLLFSSTFDIESLSHYSSVFGADASVCVFHALPRITDRKAVNGIAKFKRWCPHCLRDHNQDPAFGYAFPLIWSLELVRHCPVHSCHLDFQCGNCHREQPYININYEPGYCDYCGFGLFNSRPLPATEEEMELTKLVQSLNWDSVKHKVMQHNHIGIFQKNLEAIAKELGDIDGEELSESFGFDRKVFNSWRQGQSKPNIESLIIFLKAIDLHSPYYIWFHEVSVSDFSFGGQVREIQRELKLRQRSKVSNETRGEIETYLSEIMSGKRPAISKRALAKKFEVSIGFLEYNYSSRLRDVASLAKVKQEKSSVDKRSDIQIQMNRAVQKVLSKGREPSIERVAKFLPLDILKTTSNDLIFQALHRALEVKKHLIRNSRENAEN